MALFVLVHGAWHGGWCWKKVAPLLRAAGHTVLTPTLTGLGEEDLAWIQPRLTAQPLRRSLEYSVPLLATHVAQRVPPTYILCTVPPRDDPAAERARSEAGWRYRELATGHDAMITAPAELAALLLDLL